jgi:hypothetical protein
LAGVGCGPLIAWFWLCRLNWIWDPFTILICSYSYIWNHLLNFLCTFEFANSFEIHPKMLNVSTPEHLAITMIIYPEMLWWFPSSNKTTYENKYTEWFLMSMFVVIWSGYGKKYPQLTHVHYLLPLPYKVQYLTFTLQLTFTLHLYRQLPSTPFSLLGYWTFSLQQVSINLLLWTIQLIRTLHVYLRIMWYWKYFETHPDTRDHLYYKSMWVSIDLSRDYISQNHVDIFGLAPIAFTRSHVTRYATRVQLSGQ